MAILLEPEKPSAHYNLAAALMRAELNVQAAEMWLNGRRRSSARRDQGPYSNRARTPHDAFRLRVTAQGLICAYSLLSIRACYEKDLRTCGASKKILQ